jgi:four helix bundle protein
MRNFRELEIWKRSIDLVDQIYQHSNGLPDNEKYGLISQIRRCAVSVPSNIAEGCSRKTNKDLARFLEIALGSSFELETQLIIIARRNMLEKKIVEALVDELNQIQRMINSFRSKIKEQSPNH